LKDCIFAWDRRRFVWRFDSYRLCFKRRVFIEACSCWFCHVVLLK